MPSLDLSEYFSQWDGDAEGFNGLCAETCLKMADHYYTGRSIGIADIMRNGDGVGSYTSELGAIKAAKWLGLNPVPTSAFWSDITREDLIVWIGRGNLVMAYINYGLIPARYKHPENRYQDTHAMLITAITYDGSSIRVADPNFWDSSKGARSDGWFDNNKWIDANSFFYAWSKTYKPYAGLQFNVVKKGTQPLPPVEPDPCAVEKKRIIDLEKENAKLIDAKNMAINKRKSVEIQLRTSNTKINDLIELMDAKDNLYSKAQQELRIREVEAKEMQAVIDRLNEEKQQELKNHSLIALLRELYRRITNRQKGE